MIITVEIPIIGHIIGRDAAADGISAPIGAIVAKASKKRRLSKKKAPLKKKGELAGSQPLG